MDTENTNFHTTRAKTVKIERDRQRNLKRLTTPDQNSVDFEYDGWNRVVRAFDNQKRLIHYFYDVAGRLIEVQKASLNTRFDYDYDDITAIYENGQRLVEFKYVWGRLDQILLFGGRKYRIRYDRDPTDKSKILRTYLTEPDGRVTKFDIKPE